MKKKIALALVTFTIAASSAFAVQTPPVQNPDYAPLAASPFEWKVGDRFVTQYGVATYVAMEGTAGRSSDKAAGAHCLLPGATVIVLGRDAVHGVLARVQAENENPATDSAACGAGSLVFLDVHERQVFNRLAPGQAASFETAASDDGSIERAALNVLATQH